MSMLKRLMVLFLLLPCGAMGAAAGDANSERLELPRLLKWQQSWPKVKNEYGMLVDDKHREARVVIGFTVTSEGKTADIGIEDGFYDENFAAKAIEMVKYSRWKPALLNGKQVDYSDMKLAVIFSLEKSELTRTFLDAMEEAVVLIRAGKLEAAHEQVEEMAATKVKWLYEYVTLQAALAETYQKTGYPLHAVVASRRATATYSGLVPRMTLEGGKVPRNLAKYYMLPEPMLSTALQRRFLLDVSLGLDRDAMQAFTELQGLGTLPPDSPLPSMASTITKRMKSSEPLVGRARVDELGVHGHKLFRNTFSVIDVVGGGLQAIDFACAGVQRVERWEMPFRNGGDWTLPGKRSGCTLLFKGEPGTEFKIVETGDPLVPLVAP